MKKLTHSESEIIKSVNELEAGISADVICRKLNVSRTTLYQWKRKYGGLDIKQLKRLKELEEENLKLKKMYANFARSSWGISRDSAIGSVFSIFAFRVIIRNIGVYTLIFTDSIQVKQHLPKMRDFVFQSQFCGL